MKWRDGIFVCCPFCDAPRDGAGHQENQALPYLRSIARVHHYACGAEVIENYTLKREFLQMTVAKTCAGACLVLSKAMSAIVNEKKLETWSSFSQQFELAKLSANVLSRIIHKSISNCLKKNDNWRLPPIPQIKTLNRLAEKGRK